MLKSYLTAKYEVSTRDSGRVIAGEYGTIFYGYTIRVVMRPQQSLSSVLRQAQSRVAMSNVDAMSRCALWGLRFRSVTSTAWQPSLSSSGCRLSRRSASCRGCGHRISNETG